MKKKLIGILVCMMLMTTFFTVAKNVEKDTLSSEPNSQATVTFGDTIPVPVWKVGDYWDYQINTIVIDLDEEGFSVHISLETENLSLNVIDDTGDSYTVEIKATINGNGYAYMNFGDGPINITGELKDTTLTGNIIFNKSDLGIKHIEATLDGRIKLTVIENPYIPMKIPMNIPATIIASADSSVPYPIIDFPLNVSNTWGLPATNISIDGTIQSIWLNIINWINTKARNHWRIVEIIAGFIDFDPDMLKIISDILADILPIIDISYVLTKYVGIEPVFAFPEVPDIFMCNNTENITVGGRTFFVYNISVGGGIGSMYYAPDAGTIVKISGRFKDIIPFINDINAELIETNYQP
ncbi:MAG: hypothetical protein IMZ43_04375 [Thermoplasmata archaeon]|nr:hypothetical protein [Thermoplasmata archaeon]